MNASKIYAGLLDWVDIRKIDWVIMSDNKNAIHLLEKKPPGSNLLNEYFIGEIIKKMGFLSGN